jgi:hypothetical protein
MQKRSIGIVFWGEKLASGFKRLKARLMGVLLRLRRIRMTAAIKCHLNVKPAILMEVFSSNMMRCGAPFGKLRTGSETRFGGFINTQYLKDWPHKILVVYQDFMNGKITLV